MEKYDIDVVVFDCGWGGEIIGDFIAEEIPFRVEKVIDYKNAQYGEKDFEELRDLVERALLKYIGKVRVIVLADAVMALELMDYLQRKYPRQKFVGYGRGLVKMIRMMGMKKVMVLTTNGVKKQGMFKMMEKMAEARIVEPECRGWGKKIDDGEMMDGEVRRTVEKFRGDAVVIYATGFLDVEENIKKYVKKRTKVVDMKGVLLKDVCEALGLVGKDGRTTRERLKEAMGE